MPEHEYDIVLYGATGFVGQLTAEYITRHAPDGLRWAIAGRNRAKLETVRGELMRIDPRVSDLPVIEVDAADDRALAAMVESTRIITSTVGPYAVHGEPLVRACAESGTHYADLTGEPGFVDDMYVKYDAIARESGAKIVHCCGFDSMPADLGAYFTVLQLPENVPIDVSSRVRANGMYSGGTVHSAINGFAHAWQTISAARARRRIERSPAGRTIGMLLRPLQRDRRLQMWVAPLPTIDQFVAMRSAAALERYGPHFRYGHNFAAKRLSTVLLGVSGVTAVFLLAQIPPARRLLLKRFPAGSGPSPSAARSTFRVEFVGEGGGRSVRTAISGGDAGYEETAKMLGEMVFALAGDDLPDVAGQLTPVIAAGDALLARLPAAGIKLEVVE